MTPDESQVVKLTINGYTDQAFKDRAGEPWVALFNPSELSFSRKNTYNQQLSAGSSQPQVSYGGGQPDEVTVDLLLDGTGVVDVSQTVRQRVDGLLEFTTFQPNTHQPTYVHMHWASFNFLGVISQADVTYTMFDRDSEPLRAKVKLTLQKAIAPEQVQKQERAQSPDLYQTWEVTEGETLDLIAHSVYGSPAYWRPLAAANRLANPWALSIGQTLLLPPMAQAGRRR